MKNVFEILSLLSIKYDVYGEPNSGDITELKSVMEANESSFVFIADNRNDQEYIAEKTCAKLILCGNFFKSKKKYFANKTLIVVDNPKLVYAKIANLIFNITERRGIHPTAVIAESAIISKTASIGPFVSVGEHCVIGENTTIHSNCSIYDKSIIGDDVIIHANSAVGMDGFGYIPDEDGENINFLHIGSVRIENKVVIGSNSSICKGALGNTTIGENTKIDNQVHIAHNVIVGRNCLIAANAMIAGSVSIGDNVWVGPGVNLTDCLEVSDNAAVTIGSSVIENVDKGQRVTGYFAQPHYQFMKKYLKFFK